jgi:hypothetical protein
MGTSVGDPEPHPDPYVFGSPGSEFGSVSHKYGSSTGSGSETCHHPAKIVRKTLISSVLCLHPYQYVTDPSNDGDFQLQIPNPKLFREDLPLL